MYFSRTCMELLARLPELREPRALPKWLMQVAHHQCYRSKQQQKRTVSRDAEPGLPVPETPAIAESLIQQTQEEQILREATAALTPQCRRLVELLFFETPARPYAEVARELGLSVGSIGFTRQKCIERLRRHLDQLGSADARRRQRNLQGRIILAAGRPGRRCGSPAISFAPQNTSAQ